jgi:hypothetical protein
MSHFFYADMFTTQMLTELPINEFGGIMRKFEWVDIGTQI